LKVHAIYANGRWMSLKYTVSQKKHATPGSGITLANADQFLKFFHCGLGNKSQQEPCYTPNASRACKRSKI